MGEKAKNQKEEQQTRLEKHNAI